MRVSKAVKEYIEDRVNEKLMTKYAPEREQAKSEQRVEREILTAASEAARALFIKLIEEGCANHDFLEINRNSIPSCYNVCAISIKDRVYLSSVHNWERRMKSERDEITRNIIVQLELGGNKDDLERMLSEI